MPTPSSVEELARRLRRDTIAAPLFFAAAVAIVALGARAGDPWVPITRALGGLGGFSALFLLALRTPDRARAGLLNALPVRALRAAHASTLVAGAAVVVTLGALAVVFALEMSAALFSFAPSEGKLAASLSLAFFVALAAAPAHRAVLSWRALFDIGRLAARVPVSPADRLAWLVDRGTTDEVLALERDGALRPGERVLFARGGLVVTDARVVVLGPDRGVAASVARDEWARRPLAELAPEAKPEDVALLEALLAAPRVLDAPAAVVRPHLAAGETLVAAVDGDAREEWEEPAATASFALTDRRLLMVGGGRVVAELRFGPGAVVVRTSPFSTTVEGPAGTFGVGRPPSALALVRPLLARPELRPVLLLPAPG